MTSASTPAAVGGVRRRLLCLGGVVHTEHPSNVGVADRSVFLTCEGESKTLDYIYDLVRVADDADVTCLTCLVNERGVSHGR